MQYCNSNNKIYAEKLGEEELSLILKIAAYRELFQELLSVFTIHMKAVSNLAVTTVEILRFRRYLCGEGIPQNSCDNRHTMTS